MMHDNINQLNQLFNLDGDEQESKSGNQIFGQLNDVVEYRDNLVKEETKKKNKSKHSFLVMGIIFALVAAITAISAIGIIPTEISEAASFVGGILILISSIFIIKNISSQPLLDASKKLDSVYAELMKDIKQSDAYKKYSKIKIKKKNKVIAGVAGTLAEALNLEPSVVRFAFVILAFISSGTFIPLYFISALILHSSKK